MENYEQKRRIFVEIIHEFLKLSQKTLDVY
jgi:hypothetical protein